jgi:hypothetical protein
MTELRRTDVDGVPVLWAPGEGELRAGLVFRVGRVDETLARAGITHLVEHLVLYPVEKPDLHYNGATSPLTTTFFVHGGPDEICDFFALVCRSLRELPTDRLATEVAVLRTEAAGRQRGVTEPLLAWRYGPVGYGLPAFPEYGLGDLTAEDLSVWVRRSFTAGNAAMWILGGPPPPGVRLDLPDGSRLPPPLAHDALPRTPAYFPFDIDGVALNAVVPRSTATTAYVSVLNQRLHRVLRRDLGISYTAAATWDGRDADNATITAVADALPAKHAEVTREFVNVFIDLAVDPINDDELDAVRAIARRSLSDPAATGAALVNQVENLLLGMPIRTAEEVLRRLAAVTPDDVREVAGNTLSAALAMVPRGQAVGRAGFTAAPTGSAAAVVGKSYRPRNRPDSKQRLIVAAEGVSLVEGLDIATVRYDECVAMLAWPDGARLLYAPDAVNVRVEPRLWDAPQRLVAEVDARIPADRVVHMPQRSERSIPQPPDPTTEDTRDPATSSTDRKTFVRRYSGVAIVLASAAAVVALAISFHVPAAGMLPALGILLYRGIRSMRSGVTTNNR